MQCPPIPNTGHFNPLPPYGGRPLISSNSMSHFSFQSTPSVWRETFLDCVPEHTEEFQSTPSVWRETLCFSTFFAGFYISIHSLRMEGDFFSLLPHLRRRHFNPLPPYGGRPILPGDWIARNHFNPLPPYGGRLKPPMFIGFVMTFQSTPSVWRETVRQVLGRRSVHHFNPLPPYGGRPA